MVAGGEEENIENFLLISLLGKFTLFQKNSMSFTSEIIATYVASHFSKSSV